jgi:hypothetical protein
METQMKVKASTILQSGYKNPDFSILRNNKNESFDSEFSQALNFANYTFESVECKVFLQKYIDIFLEKKFNINCVPDYYCLSNGHLAWLKINGADLKEDTLERLNRKIEELFILYSNLENEEKTNTTKNKTDSKHKNTSIIISEISGAFDDIIYRNSDKNIIDKIISTYTFEYDKIYIIDYFNKILDEVKNNDKEYFKFKRSLIINTLEYIIDKFDSIKLIKRKKKSQRIKKINPVKMVKKLLYKTEDKDYNLYSISPELIIGSNVLWTFNTKNRQLGQYIAQNGTTLGAKGSTITNYDEDLSFSKKIRNVEDNIKKLLESGKVEQRKLLSTIKAQPKKLNGRINKHTILVKIF